MLWCKYLFWFSCAVVFYNYIGYALIVYVINLVTKKKKPEQNEYFPSVSFIVAAYNEEDFIEKKIKNCLEFNYPKELIEFIFITDGSTDRTSSIVAKYKEVILLNQDKRQGKSAALNRAVQKADNEILIFNDANTSVNADAVKKIAQHYYDQRTGGVAGEKKVLEMAGNENQNTANEGLYWKYESFLKQIDSDFYSVVGAAGELFSVRKELFEPVSSNVILDDFVISMKVAQKGYRVRYEKNAYATELPSASISEEKKRKVRIAAGGFQAIVMLKSAFRFWKYPRLFFLYFSHRVLRWAGSPFCLVLAFLSNLALVLYGSSRFWITLFVFQLCFYLTGLIIHFVFPENTTFKPAKLIYYFIFMNFSVLAGFVRYLKGNQSALWDKAKRAQTQG